MKVTDLQYGLENRLIQKLDIMIKRCTNPTKRKDALLIIEGGEGEGKTNSSEAVGYYVKYKTNRQFHMFFRLEPMIQFAKNTENMIIIWDEPSLDSLSTDWYKEVSVNLTRLLMTCRKKRHFLIFNFVKFYKFNEYITVDRSLGLIHMYSRDGVETGRFFYIRKKNLEGLYVDYKQKKKRNYKKYKSFGGTFPVVEHLLGKMGLTIEGTPNCDLEMYEKLKDKAIESIGKDKKADNIDKKKLNELKIKVGKLKCPILTRENLAFQLDLSSKTLQRWAIGGDVEEKDTEIGQT